ncbi:MAG: 2-keto-4-pentenoate hydratase, partial [Candidatus Thorarchaeota archaeon]
MTDVAPWAKYLLDAEQRHEPVALITETEPNLTIEEAYEIQEALVRQKLAGGQRIVGAKLGLTSRAKQEAMGVHEPLYAWLTDAMVLPAETPLSLSELIHPRVEPEIVFVMGEELAGPGVTAYDVLAATSGVGCGLEI